MPFRGGDGDVPLQLSSSDLPYTSFLNLPIFLSTSSISSHSSRIQFPSIAITMRLHVNSTFLILIYLAISSDGSDLIVTLLTIASLAAEV